MTDSAPTDDEPRNTGGALTVLDPPSSALVGPQAMLPILPFDPPDPPDDPKIVSGATTTYGLGPVAIVPYTAVPADAGYPEAIHVAHERGLDLPMLNS